MPLLAAIGEAAARAYGMYGRGGTTQAGFSGTISSNQTNLNLRTWALANGWNGTLPATITVGAGVYVYSTATGTPAMTINGSWPGGVTVVNSGFIMGMGGTGGIGPYSFSGGPAVSGQPGGSAISLGINATIVNNSYIGGGGGGGGGGIGNGTYETPGGGGGAGAGQGGWGSYANGGAGGAPGASGANAADGTYGAPGGGGGRIMPGTGGAGGTADGGGGVGGGRGGGSGGGGGGTSGSSQGFTGGAGGSAGAVGVTPFTGGTPAVYPIAGCGGGGWGAAGGGYAGPLTYTVPGAGGKAIALNGFTATTSGSGTTYGAVS